MSYGLITEVDARALERSLLRVHERFDGPLSIVEIGICHGDTSRALKSFLDHNGIPFSYTGIDNNRDLPVAVPFDGANLLIGQSEEVYVKLEKPVHWVFIDGCHAANAVMLDFLNYGDLLEVGGEMVFHDAAPYTQEKLDWQGMGPKDHVDFGTATRTACRRLGLLDGSRADWTLVEQVWLPSWDSGGVIVVEKLWQAEDAL